MAAVAIDGPSHFVEDATGARTWLSTPTLMRNTTLRKLWGSQVAAIPIVGWAGHFCQQRTARMSQSGCAAGVPVGT